MGIDINGITINSSNSGIVMSNGVGFNNEGVAYTASVPGYSGYKDIVGNDVQYSATTGWEINNAAWTSGHLNTTTGVFTCPVAGYYAVGFNGIGNGGAGFDTGTSYGYAGFAKNGALSYYIHWSLRSSNSWQQTGGSSIFQCAVNDTLAFFINRAPTPVGTAQTYNRGWYPHNHHAVWCILVG